MKAESYRRRLRDELADCNLREALCLAEVPPDLDGANYWAGRAQGTIRALTLFESVPV